MYATALIVSAISIAAAASPLTSLSPRQAVQVASVDRYSGAGCTGTICNIAGSGDLYRGCNVITGSCQASLRLNYANSGCKGKKPCSFLFLLLSVFIFFGTLNPGVGMEPDECVVAIFTDTACSTSKQFANLTTVGTCYALGDPIRSISVTC